MQSSSSLKWVAVNIYYFILKWCVVVTLYKDSVYLERRTNFKMFVSLVSVRGLWSCKWSKTFELRFVSQLKRCSLARAKKLMLSSVLAYGHTLATNFVQKLVDYRQIGSRSKIEVCEARIYWFLFVRKYVSRDRDYFLKTIRLQNREKDGIT